MNDPNLGVVIGLALVAAAGWLGLILWIINKFGQN